MHIPMSRFLQVIVVIGFLPSAINAQYPSRTRTIFGTITDDKGQPIERALIIIQEIGDSGTKGSINLTTRSNKTGKYLYWVGIKDRTFRVIVHQEGFKPAWEEKIAPQYGEEKEVNFQLQPGEDFTTSWEQQRDEDVIQLVGLGACPSIRRCRAYWACEARSRREEEAMRGHR
jgi:hypothetical protein